MEVCKRYICMRLFFLLIWKKSQRNVLRVSVLRFLPENLSGGDFPVRDEEGVIGLS